ncbi:MAG: hypothetical protein IH996_00810 [Proteobacteria bacterium]|nr:hypothetical protein [Pseudomonadota bacterium]
MSKDSTLEQALLDKIDVLIRLQAVTSVANFDSQKDKILFLGKAGVSPKDIAEILGTSANTVSVTLSRARNTSANKGKK